MWSVAEERAELIGLFEEVGPDRPTLCAGWTTADLLAHLVTRERRPDTLPGIVARPFAGWTERVRRSYRALPWPELIDLFRRRPPVWSLFRDRRIAERSNAAEYLVHHEDVRRVTPDWEPRPVDSERDRAVRALLARGGRIYFRNSSVGVLLRELDGTRTQVKGGSTPVTMIGDPVEALLFAFGRPAVRLEFVGAPESVAALLASARAI
jgi:uncharacterized protein (TIGR03085 family)